MKYILYFGLCALVMYILYLNFFRYNVEGYESLIECKKQGYGHDFCMRVPIQSMINTSPYLHN